MELPASTRGVGAECMSLYAFDKDTDGCADSRHPSAPRVLRFPRTTVYRAGIFLSLRLRFWAAILNWALGAP